MAEVHSTERYSEQQAESYKAANSDFPLRWHPRGGWCKKIRGRVTYYGKVTPDEALARYHQELPYLERGEVPPAYEPDAITLLQLCNEFLAAKKTRVASGELSQTTWKEYKRTADNLLAHFGQHRSVASIAPIDFVAYRAKLAEGRKLVALKNEVNRARIIFKFAFDAGLIDKPIRYGENFRRPNSGSMRKARNKIGRQDFTAKELKAILKTAKGDIRAMVLLGINAGLGNSDCAKLDASMIDLAGGWLDCPRNKTGAIRRAKLWKETVAALKPFVNGRTAGRVFSTVRHNPYDSVAISRAFDDVLEALGLQKEQRGFYGLRRSFRTIADECGDQPAIDVVMGHAHEADDMAAIYRQTVADDRLAKVAEHVRKAIFGKRGAK